MTILSRLFSHFAKLPPPETTHVRIEQDLVTTMPDGVILLADRYSPHGIEKPPLILVRCCYGRRGFFGFVYGRIFAERGFQVVVQSTRGTFGSGGVFNPFADEHDDGLATVDWLKQQSWYPGSFMTNGPSYLGFVQWAIARDAGPDLRAMAVQVSTSEFRSQIYEGEAFTLHGSLNWAYLIAHQERTTLLKQLFAPATRVLQPIFAHLPLRDLAGLANSEHSTFFQDWLEHNEPGDTYWKARDFAATVKEVTVPIHMIGGWYDIFLPWQLCDYRVLCEAGNQPSLTIGPWVHASRDLIFYGLRETLSWLKAVQRDETDRYRQSPVRIFVTGANEWRDLAAWPPPDVMQKRFHLQPDGSLATDLPPTSEPDQYRYDPADPTPSLAGPMLMGKSLPTDNRKLEARSDVLTYTSAPLDQYLEVIGPVQIELFVKSSRAHTDFFVRLCDVEHQGKSINVCDALQRVKPSNPAPNQDGTLHITFNLWPTAHRFRVGHRLRVQVSSGALPRYARNTGSGEPLAIATKLLVADQAIYHDPEHPSSIILPVPQERNEVGQVSL